MPDPEPDYIEAITKGMDELQPEGDPPAGEQPTQSPAPNEPTIPPSTPGPEALLTKQPDPEPQPAPEDAKTKEATELTKGLSQKASEKFKAIHSRAWEAEQKIKQLETLQSELDELKAKPPVPNDYEELKKNNEQLNEIVQKTALTDSPTFRERFDNRIVKKIGEAKALVGPELEGTVERVLNMADSPARNQLLEQMTDGMSAFKLSRLNTILSESDGLIFERDQVISNWREEKSKYLQERSDKEHQQAKAQSEQLEALANTIEGAITQNGQGGVDVFVMQDGNEDWNKEVGERLAIARKLLSPDVSQKERVAGAYKAASSDKYRQLFYHYFKQAGELQKKLEAVKNAQPGTGSPTPTQPTGDIDRATDYIDAIEKAGQELGFLR